MSPARTPRLIHFCLLVFYFCFLFPLLYLLGPMSQLIDDLSDDICISFWVGLFVLQELEKVRAN